ncbi:MAG: GxxExxY protein [Bacteroidota bacterium]
MTEIIFKEESYKIIGSCFEVYNELGPGYLEAVYQEALSVEFTKQNIPFVAQGEMNVFYKGIELKKKYYPDFRCFDIIILEIKAEENLYYTPILLSSQDENNKLKCNNPSDFWMMSTYDYEFVSAIHHENINGTQFHPEKSQDAGYELLKKFAQL